MRIILNKFNEYRYSPVYGSTSTVHNTLKKRTTISILKIKPTVTMTTMLYKNRQTQ